MPEQLRYGTGRASVEVTGGLKKTILQALKAAEGDLIQILSDELKEIEAAAVKNWPVRQKKFGKSQDSKGRFQRGIRIVPPDTVEAYLTNTAPYVGAIKAGRGSSTTVGTGKRVADVLIWRPIQRRSDKIGQKIAQQLIKKARR